jgi:hypothetical protein
MCLYPFTHVSPGSWASRVSVPKNIPGNDTVGPCRLCQAVIEDPWHALFECPHPHLQEFRKALPGQIAQLTQEIVRAFRREHERTPRSYPRMLDNDGP